jgi:hypothetical protein
MIIKEEKIKTNSIIEQMKLNIFPLLYPTSLTLGLQRMNKFHVVGCISALLRPKQNSFKYQNVACQQQLPNDCGLHAVANAVSLALGEHPSGCFYDRKAMRYHLKIIM